MDCVTPIYHMDHISSCKHVCPSVKWTPLDKMVAILQTIFSNAFSRMKSFVYWLKFHWRLFLRVQFTISQHWFRWWLGAGQAPSHYLNQCWPHSLTQICSIRGRWVKITSVPSIFLVTTTIIKIFALKKSFTNVIEHIWNRLHVYLCYVIVL